MKALERNVPVGGHIIRKKVLYFAKELDVKDFKASKGWFD